MGTCTIFVFGALLEFTMTNYLSRKRPLPTEKVGFCGIGAKMRHVDNDIPATTQMIFQDGVRNRGTITNIQKRPAI